MQVMQILKAEAGSGDSLEMLQTHPLPQTRIDDIQKLLKTPEFASAVNNPNYGLFADRYQQQFLSILKTLPPAPPQKQPSAQPQQQNAQGQSGKSSNLQNQRISKPKSGGRGAVSAACDELSERLGVGLALEGEDARGQVVRRVGR
jgi:predicted Zn-dependent protease